MCPPTSTLIRPIISFIGQCSSNSTYEVAHNDRAVRLNTKQFVWVILKHLGNTAIK